MERMRQPEEGFGLKIDTDLEKQHEHASEYGLIDHSLLIKSELDQKED